MWEPYIAVIEEMLLRYFDKFHIIRHIIEAVNEVRCEEFRLYGYTMMRILSDVYSFS
ncbi:MAG: transposase [Actinomycetota bacterium]|nr:transposase [Actinomycetota bacterium]